MAAWNPEDEYDENERRDLERAIGLLTGLWTQTGASADDRFPNKRYVSGELEKEARLAIGRLLRSRKPFDTTLRYHLAELFDGLPPHQSFDGAPMARKIIFEARRSGKMNETALRYLHIADDYRRLRENGMPHKRAMGEVRDKFNVGETTVKEARRAYPQLAPRAFKKLDKRPG